MTDLMQSQVFFFISSIGFIILWILTAIVLVYILRAVRVFYSILEKVDRNIDTVGEVAKETIDEIKDSLVFRFLFKSKKKRK